MNNTAPEKPSSKWRIGLFLCMVIVGGILGVLVYRPKDRGTPSTQGDASPAAEPPASVRQLSADETRKVLAMKDTAIGHLENGPASVQVDGKAVAGTELAADGFSQLAAKLPKERLPVQNLAIARLLLLRDAQENVAERRTQAREAAQRLLDFDPESGVAYWIAAAVELVPDTTNPLGTADDARQKAVTWLKRATQLEPENPVYWFALSRGAMKPREMVPNADALAALGKAYAANPRNIFVLTDWLIRQAQAKDPTIAETLAAARQTFVPVTAAVNKPGVDIDKFLSDAITAVQGGDWKTTEAKVRMVANVSRHPDIVQSDITRVDVHPLEFVLYDFSPEFYRVNPRPEPTWTADSAVKLTVTEGRLPALAGVLDLAALDCDLNGLPDLAVLRPGKLSLVTQAKVGEPWTETASLDVPAGLSHLLAADLDRDKQKALSAPSPDNAVNAEAPKFDLVLSETVACHDADPDFVVYGEAGVVLVRNDAPSAEDPSKLVLVENQSLQTLTGVVAALLVDVDHDADLDLVCSSKQGITIWEATGNWEAPVKMLYKDISAWSQLPPADVTVTSMVAVDWDRDVDIDVVLAEPSGKVVGLLENQRHAQFRWVPFDATYQGMNAPRSVALVEADGNVSWDLLSAGERGIQLTLTATPRAGVVNYVRTEKIDDTPQDGLLVWDVDNDGFRDTAAWNAQGLSVFRGGPQGRFQNAKVVEGDVAGPVVAARSADLDRDGDQDLVVATTDRVLMLINQGNDNNWMTLYPVGQADNKGRCNHFAIGSLVELRSAGRYQAQVVDASSVHFGLGDQKRAEQVRIVWTNGVPQDIVDVTGNVAICERMVLKGSCPYIYTMAGGQFSFFSDCLWAAPLGLQNADGGVAPTRPWEYLFIPGHRLTPTDGSYWLQLTEELWEAGYFDKVQLIAIDHPADVEVYSNEKVGPPDIAQFKIHTVRQRRFPRTAVDPRGNDLRPQLQQCDGKFVKAFEQRIRQGLAPEHYIELDLGTLQDPQQITLFLTGWIFPTDTSLNVAFRQDPETDGPRMPSVWVPDADGQWKETIAYMGFPGGKTKTIAVDLSHAFLTRDYRVRIQTTAEIYWDEAFFTVDDPPAEVRQIPLTLQSADLAYRGFSGELPVQENAPPLRPRAGQTHTRMAPHARPVHPVRCRARIAGRGGRPDGRPGRRRRDHGAFCRAGRPPSDGLEAGLHPAQHRLRQGRRLEYDLRADGGAVAVSRDAELSVRAGRGGARFPRLPRLPPALSDTRDRPERVLAVPASARQAMTAEPLAGGSRRVFAGIGPGGRCEAHTGTRSRVL